MFNMESSKCRASAPDSPQRPSAPVHYLYIDVCTSVVYVHTDLRRGHLSRLKLSKRVRYRHGQASDQNCSYAGLSDTRGTLVALETFCLERQCLACHSVRISSSSSSSTPGPSGPKTRFGICFVQNAPKETVTPNLKGVSRS
jgi:hypothetical protein